jgi:hypothetical protein
VSLKSTVKRLEQQMQPPLDCVIYAPTSLLDNNQPPGMIKVTCWSKPDWVEYITQKEHYRRINEARVRGQRIFVPRGSD